MKVLYITHATDLFGANRSMLQMIRELMVNHKVEPFIVFPRIFDKKARCIKNVCEELHIPYLEHRMTNFKRHNNASLIEKLYFIIVQSYCVIHLFWLLRQYSFDLVHSNSSVNDTGAYISLHKNLPHIWHLREFGDQDFNLYSCLGSKYEKWIYKKAKFFIAISSAIKERFKQVIDENKINLIYNGVLPLGENYSSDHNSKQIRFCIVGRVEENKNQLEALHAINELRKKNIEGFKLYIIGKEDAIYVSLLRDYIQQNNLEDYCVLMGVRYDVPDLLKTMDVGLMLSTCEAFGRVTVEYMMQNLAVIVTNTGANPEIVNNNVDGLVYELGDSHMLAECMRRLIIDRELLINLAQNGQHKALNKFQSSQNSDNVYALYTKVVE